MLFYIYVTEKGAIAKEGVLAKKGRDSDRKSRVASQHIFFKLSPPNY